jgi:tetratricopeptide (TPR) repeat protein
MRSIFSVLIFLFVFAAFSCKTASHTAATTSPSNNPNSKLPPPTDGMTAGKASEEETFVKGCIDKNAGNYTRALADFQQCLTMNPKSAAANYEVAGIYVQVKQPNMAMNYAKAANDLSPDNQWYKLRYAEVLEENNLPDEALRIYKELSDNNPQNTDFLFRYGNALKKVGKNEDALKVYTKIETIEGISDTLAKAKIAVYEIMGDKVNEENTLLSLVKYFPTETNYYSLANFYHKTAFFDKENEIYKKMVLEFPDDVGPRLKNAEQILKASGDDNAAKTAFAIPGGLEEKISFLKSNYAIDSQAKLSTAQKIQADSLCAILRKVNSDDARSFSISGDYFFYEGKMKEASDNYHKAATLGQNEYAPWKKLLEINDALKDDATQEKDCKQVMELFPTQPDAYYYLGMIAYNKKDFKKANNWIQAGLDFAPDDARMNETMGDIQYQLGNVDDAVTWWTKAKEKGGTNPALEKKISTKKME